MFETSHKTSKHFIFFIKKATLKNDTAKTTYKDDLYKISKQSFW